MRQLTLRAAISRKSFEPSSAIVVKFFSQLIKLSSSSSYLKVCFNKTRSSEPIDQVLVCKLLMILLVTFLYIDLGSKTKLFNSNRNIKLELGLSLSGV